MIRGPTAAACLAASALAMVLAACGQENRYVAPPPLKVSVAIPVQQKVTRYLEAIGYASAISTTNLVARVQGFLQKINYKDGEEVKEGATLFVIEPEPYRLKLEQARAAEAGAQATLKQTELEYERQAELPSRQVSSKAALDNATANRDSARARQRSIPHRPRSTSATRKSRLPSMASSRRDSSHWARWLEPMARPNSQRSCKPLHLSGG